MRLDFDTFTITGPSTLTLTSVAVIGGNVVGATATHSGATQCSTDLFSVSNPGGSITPPSICGSNTGEHSKLYFNQLFVYKYRKQSKIGTANEIMSLLYSVEF